MRRRITIPVINKSTELDGGFEFRNGTVVLSDLGSSRQDRYVAEPAELGTLLQSVVDQPFRDIVARRSHGQRLVGLLSANNASCEIVWGTNRAEKLPLPIFHPEPEGFQIRISAPSADVLNDDFRDALQGFWGFAPNITSFIEPAPGVFTYYSPNLPNLPALLGPKSEAAYADSGFFTLKPSHIQLELSWACISDLHTSLNVSETVISPIEDVKTELGVLHAHPTVDGLLTVSGLLFPISEESRPSRTLFTVPVANDVLPIGSVNCSFAEPPGLHPKLECSADVPRKGITRLPPDAQCHFYAFHMIPSPFFADQFQIPDVKLAGSLDLEAPAYADPAWGSQALVKLPDPVGNPVSWELPLHLRYVSPGDSLYSEASLPPPLVFYACESPDGAEPPNVAKSPFYRPALGFNAYFSPTAQFVHVTGDTAAAPLALAVPRADSSANTLVAHGTAAAVILAFCYVLWKVFSPRKAAPKQKKQ